MVFDINNLRDFDAQQLFIDGYTCSDNLALAERFELSIEDTNKLCDFLESYQAKESQVDTVSIMNLDMTFIFGNYNDSFKFESKVNYLSFDDLGENVTLKINGFIMSLPDTLTMVKVGNFTFFFGFTSGICYRFFYKS